MWPFKGKLLNSISNILHCIFNYSLFISLALKSNRSKKVKACRSFFLLVPGMSTAKGLSFALQADDPHTMDFTLAILRLQENQFLERIKRKWWKKSHGCADQSRTGNIYILSLQNKSEQQSLHDGHQSCIN